MANSARGAGTNYETFLQDLHAVRDRAGRFRRGTGDEDPVGPALALALEELDVTLEELRVAEEAKWRVLLRLPDRERLQVVAWVAVDRDPAGVAQELRWLLWPAGPDGAAAAPAARLVAAEPGALDDLAEALHEVVEAATRLLGADGAGLMLADQAGALRWVTATGEGERAFERAQRDLGEGPCIDAYVCGQAVWTPDLRTDPRWPRLGPAGAGNQIRGVLSVPVTLGGRRLGTVNAVTHRPRPWTDAEAAGAGALATVIGRLLGSATEARSRSRKLDDVAREVIAGRPC